MKIIYSLFFLFISILHAEDKQVSVFQQQLAHLESLDVDPALKIGADDLKEVLTHVWGRVLPSIPVSAPNWADQFYANYSTLKFPYLFERAKRDAARYLAEVATYYPGYTGDGVPNKDNNLHILLPGYQYPQRPLLIDQVPEMLNAHPESMTCLEYLIFTANLTLKLPEHKKQLYRHQSDRFNLLEIIQENFPNHKDKKFPKNFTLPFPMHTGTHSFDGIFGELMILHSMSLGIMPIMYVVRPDCVADTDFDGNPVFFGPSQCFDHDLQHWLGVRGRPYIVSRFADQLQKFNTRSDLELVFHLVHEYNFAIQNSSYKASLQVLQRMTPLLHDYYITTINISDDDQKARIYRNFCRILSETKAPIIYHMQNLFDASQKSDREVEIYIAIFDILNARDPEQFTREQYALDTVSLLHSNPDKYDYGMDLLKEHYTGFWMFSDQFKDTKRWQRYKNSVRPNT